MSSVTPTDLVNRLREPSLRDPRQTIEDGPDLGGEIAGPWREAALEQHGANSKTIDAGVVEKRDLIAVDDTTRDD